MQTIWGAFKLKCFICRVIFDTMTTPGSGLGFLGSNLRSVLEEVPEEDPFQFELGFAAPVGISPNLEAFTIKDAQPTLEKRANRS
jgi:hypothetical protein